MMNRIPGVASVSILACFLGAAMAAAQTPSAGPGHATAPSTPTDAEPASEYRVPARQDGRFITKLRWVSPNGELPGTYTEYLQRHPLQPAHFSNQLIVKPPADAPKPRNLRSSGVSILVDEDLYPTVTTRLDEYVTDLTSQGYSVFLETVSGGTPEDIKAWVQSRHASGSDQIVFVGDITAAWAEVSGDVFPCDLFYMDVDGHWEDADVDGDYETHNAGTGDEGPEVCVSRVYAYTLNYDTEANMVNGYFAKAHDYHTGALSQPWQGLEYVDEDWYDMDVALDLVYGSDVVRHDYGYYTTAEDYLNQMDLTQHFVQVCAHSYSGGHHFGMRPTESAVYAHTYVYSPSTRAAVLLLGSNDGIKVWLNGNNVCTHDVYHEWQPDQYTHGVTLNEGWNRLLCKVSQAGGDYAFSARFTDFSWATFPDLEYQLSDPNMHGPQAQFIRGWLLNGFHQDTSENFWNYLNTNYLGVNHGELNPQEGEVTGGKTWTTYSTSGGFVDMGNYCDEADFGVCYAFARIYADAATSCQLWLGYDDGAKVWLNGIIVLNDNRYGDFAPDMTKINVNLNAGENRLLMKVSEWMGPHGFSARFAYADGSLVEGLTYDPEPDPISFIGTWLVNGPYLNPDQGTRLSEDYLGGEADVRPSEGDSAPFGTWEMGTGSGEPFDIAAVYDVDGGWVYSQTIQDRDPPVLFYNLFSCGPGRFTDDNYLAGAYIFNTTHGLITVASSKSGSMLNFYDFTDPLGQGKTIGTAYREWFDAQAPFDLWEREWYYGMVLCGLPTLRVVQRGDCDADGDVDLQDFLAFQTCYTGPGGSLSPGCECVDFNGDGDVDLQDFLAFQVAFTGPGV